MGEKTTEDRLSSLEHARTAVFVAGLFVALWLGKTSLYDIPAGIKTALSSEKKPRRSWMNY
ncbi:hypothetical protein [Methylocystis parvus]|uniref:Uncharacterized protein n=1 Tax=Methylocystis parvus TaxID=134 RepID=A0A6B8M6V7_9HYPH|nr:hypothetical protein [Methylocystis parvus]QGM98581.1 hypothetical protein F7D14_14580 [Methylocystis parvus]WBK01076.1 hypothetical protein MMG94_04990 [Methylocystis parvus OBBP]